MYTTPVIALLLTTLVEARFGQEQGDGAIQKINDLGNFGKPGEAGTLAGGSIALLLAAANPCKKLEQADLIVQKLGDDEKVIEAARGLVAAEINFNPFVTSVPKICAEPSLPKTEALRGVVPKIDPAVVGSEEANKNAVESIKTPFDAKGLSQAEVMVQHGTSNFTSVKLDGTEVNTSSLGAAKTSSVASSNSLEKKIDTDEKKNDNDSGSSSAASSKDDMKKDNDSGNSSAASSEDEKKNDNDSGSSSAASSKDDMKKDNDSGNSSAASSEDDKKNDNDSGNSSAASSKDDMKKGNDSGNSSAASSEDEKKNDNDSGNTNAASTSGAGDAKNTQGTSAQDADKSQPIDDPKTGTFDGFKASSIQGLDFGKCVPTMKFEPGLNGRKETEFTFQAADPLVNKGQSEALNPNIITNRIKDQLSNACGANQAAKDAAVEAMATIASLNKRDASVAETWNTKLGFDGADLNPDKAPKAGLIGHT